ncbi:hypothetical protein A2J03_28195 [Rhodococcus sp. EPR-157]|nr:hypothetical protein A2J03_28195 [Rhodococcus sp. EPR-157]
MIESSMSTTTRPGAFPGEQRCRLCQRDQHPGGDGVELADVPEGELAKERSQRRRCVRPVEECTHRSVPKYGGVGDGIGAEDHRPDHGGDLEAGVRAFVGRDAQVLLRQVLQPGSSKRAAATGRV